MILLQGIVIVSIIKISYAEVNCNTSKSFVRQREHLRTWIKDFGSIYTIVDYAILKNFSNKPPHAFHFITNFEVDLRIPAVILINSDKNFEMFAVSSKSNDAFGNLNLISRTVHVNPDFLQSEECASFNPLTAVHFLDNWSESHCFALWTCKISTTSQENTIYEVTNELIIWTNKAHNRSMINRYISGGNVTRKFVKFSEFDEEGFCVCEKMQRYLNDCHDVETEEDPDVKYHFMLITLTFLMLFLAYEIYCYLIK